jgi:hypothetical protein
MYLMAVAVFFYLGTENNSLRMIYQLSNKFIWTPLGFSAVQCFTEPGTRPPPPAGLFARSGPHSGNSRPPFFPNA